MLEQLGHYKILDRVGEGSLGEVYRARDTLHGRTVAVKVLPEAIAADPSRRARMLADADAAARLSHPNIATLYEAGDDQGRLFLVFEFVPGQPLGAVIGGRPMNPRTALHLSGQLADAIADAHAQGVAHRDLRPANVVVTRKGNAKILDCGFSAWTGSAPDPVATATADAGEPDGQLADIRSLGLILHEMLTGRLPSTTPAPPADVVARELPAELAQVVGRALSREPGRRYESAATFAADVRAVDAAMDVRAREAEKLAPPALPAGARRRRSMAPWIAIALTAAGLGAGWWFVIR